MPLKIIPAGPYISLCLFHFLSSLQNVTMDVAEDRNTGQNLANEVEECKCPVGYRGTSCEECDVGYYREDRGLNLGVCEPCQCNGYSKQCDPKTGACLVIYRFIVLKIYIIGHSLCIYSNKN